MYNYLSLYELLLFLFSSGVLSTGMGRVCDCFLRRQFPLNGCRAAEPCTLRDTVLFKKVFGSGLSFLPASRQVCRKACRGGECTRAWLACGLLGLSWLEGYVRVKGQYRTAAPLCEGLAGATGLHAAGDHQWPNPHNRLS